MELIPLECPICGARCDLEIRWHDPEAKADDVPIHVHEKVYAAHILTTYPPQQDWICRTCGAEGREIAMSSGRDQDAYDALVRQFRKEN